MTEGDRMHALLPSGTARRTLRSPEPCCLCGKPTRAALCFSPLQPTATRPLYAMHCCPHCFWDNPCAPARVRPAAEEYARHLKSLAYVSELGA